MMGEIMGAWLFMMLLFVAIMVGICRWVFRVNHIVKRLDGILEALQGAKS